MIENKSRKYYEEIFSSGIESYWEKAPGKNVLLNAIRHYYEINMIPRDAKIIDIGCGSGFFLDRISHEIRNNNFQLYGVDFSSTAIRKGKELYHYNLYCEDGGQTHFDDNEFNILVSYGTYEHFEDPSKGIKELSRILMPGGLFFCMMPTLGIDRTDRDEEGWYEERQTEGSPIRQMQWNLKRHTWEHFFLKYGLTLLSSKETALFGAKKPGVFFFGSK